MNWSWQICSTRYEKLQLRLRASQATLKGVVMNHLTRVERFYSSLSANLYHDSQENVLTLISINLEQHPAWNIHFTSTFRAFSQMMYHKHISDDLGFHTNYVYLFLWLGKGNWLRFPTLIGQALLSSFLSLFLQFPSHTTASYNGMWWDVAADCITSKTVLSLFIKGLPEPKGNIFKFFKLIIHQGCIKRFLTLFCTLLNSNAWTWSSSFTLIGYKS